MCRKHIILDDIQLQEAYYNSSKNKFGSNLIVETNVLEGQLFQDWLWKYDIAYYLEKYSVNLDVLRTPHYLGEINSVVIYL